MTPLPPPGPHTSRTTKPRGTCAASSTCTAGPASPRTWEELQRDLKDGPKATIDRLLAGKARSRACRRTSRRRPRSGRHAPSEPGRLRAWWLYRMLFGPDPLGERLTLLWHNHFATSNAKVETRR